MILLKLELIPDQIKCEYQLTEDFLYSMLSERLETESKMWGAWPTLGVTMFYLYFVLWAGPKAMASRKPFSIKPLLLLYNFFMVFYCFAWVYKVNYNLNITLIVLPKIYLE